MSEEEIIKEIKVAIKSKGSIDIGDLRLECLQGLLDLYNKEKSLNEVLKSKTFKDICYNIGEFDNRFISKEKLYKAIKELQDELGIAEELQDEMMNKNIKCEYCKEGKGRSILHDEEYDFLNIFIKNGVLWEKTNDMGIKINYCPICGRKLGE